MRKYNISFKNLLPVFMFLPLVLFVYSCGSSGESSVGSSGQALRVVIDFPEDRNDETELVNAETSRTLEDLDTCLIMVAGGTPPINEIIRQFDIDEPKRVSVPVGDNRMFTFIGQDEQGQPLCKGETTVDINPDTNSVTIGCEFVDEICSDGMDNDFDDFIDCADSDCDRSSCSSEVVELLCISGSCVEPTPEPTAEPTPEPTNNPACPDPSFPSPFPNPFPGECFPPPPPPSCPAECFCDGGCFCCEFDQGGRVIKVLK